ncbi:MAG: trmD [Massilibacillus sp.]|jgi:tRNA (guanine37-N1)-methyltransferase|nr:trmD [Massilibacillus sp.]
MRIDIVSLFPDMFTGPFGCSIIKRAIDRGVLDINLVNPRQFAYDKHQMVDDYPFGGGDGMVLKPEPIFRAVEHIEKNTNISNKRVILMCPSGKPFSQEKTRELATYDQLIFICGHYEGFDARISNHLVDEAISIGDYVLTGGELAAMVIVDATSRMIPGVLGSEHSAPTDSFYNGLLEHPQYTRPREFNGLIVPEILLSGNHAKIETWRQKESLKNTFINRPDLIDHIELNDKQNKLLKEIKEELGGK